MLFVERWQLYLAMGTQSLLDSARLAELLYLSVLFRGLCLSFRLIHFNLQNVFLLRYTRPTVRNKLIGSDED